MFPPIPIPIDTFAQAATPVRKVLVTRGYVIAFLLLFAMVYVRFRTRQRFKQWVYLAFGVVIVCLFLFSTGTVWYEYPAPGVIFSIALTVLGFFSGVAVSWVTFGPEDIFVQHHREHNYAKNAEEDTKTEK